MKNMLSARKARYLLTIAVVLTIVAAPSNFVLAQKSPVKKPPVPTVDDQKTRQRADALLAQMIKDSSA